MANYNPKFTIEWQLRDCEVDGRPGLFHTWEHYSRPVEASVLRGGAPAGFVSGVVGIVEFTDGVKRVEPDRIKFCDEQVAYLQQWEQYKKEKKENDILGSDTHA